MVMGGDSCSEGCGFESQQHILDGHFSHIFVVKIVVFEKTKINEKEAGDGPFKKRVYTKSNLLQPYLSESVCANHPEAPGSNP